MKIVIIAATGGIGRQLLEQAVAGGHDVTAVVRSPHKLTGQQIRIVAADLATPDSAALESAIAGAEAVLSGLGARSAAEAGVAWRGTRAIVEAMQATGVRRIVVVSAAPIGTVRSPDRPHPPKHDPGDGFFMRHLGARFARTAFRAHYADLARMEDVVRASDLDWTISRPPKLTNKPLTGRYRTALGHNLRGGFSVPRADVAHQMLRALDQPETVKQFVGIAS
jgi:putative NADH-flavin reductase